VAMHGAVTCVRDFPIFAKIMQRKRIADWFEAVESLRTAGAQRVA